MEKMVFRVFQILAVTMIAFFVLDTSMVVWSATDTYTKMNSILEVAQVEVSRHNTVTEEMADVLDAQLTEVVERTPVPGIITAGRKNFGNSINGQSWTSQNNLNYRGSGSTQNSAITAGDFTSISQPDRSFRYIGESQPNGVCIYGDIEYLAVEMTLSPQKMYVGDNTPLSRLLERTGGNTWGDIDLLVERQTPCLRYTK